MSHYVVTQDIDGKHFFVMTAPTPEFPAILIGGTTSSEAAKSFCRELNILAEQVDQSAERNLRLVTRLQLLLADIDVDRLVDNPEPLSVLRNSSAAMFEMSNSGIEDSDLFTLMRELLSKIRDHLNRTNCSTFVDWKFTECESKAIVPEINELLARIEKGEQQEPNS